jgi:hypothetical protein
LKNTIETSAQCTSLTLCESAQDKQQHPSSKKREANCRNAQLSTGPKTESGKNHSRRNALKHGILTSSLLITEGPASEDKAEYGRLLGELREDRQPIGTLEDLLVETIAVCSWRKGRVLRSEAALVKKALLPHSSRQLERTIRCDMGLTNGSENDGYQNDIRVPLGGELDRILRYEATIHRQMVYAIGQLERLQRLRKGENVPAPVDVRISNVE